MRGAEHPPRPRWVPVVAGVIVVLTAVAMVAAPRHQRAAAAVAVLALAALASWGHPDRLAWCWGALIPLDLATGVPTALLDAARYGGLVWLCFEFVPDLSAPRRPIVTKLAVLAGVVAVIRGLGSLARVDRFGMFIAAVMLVGAVTAPFVALRVRSHVAILAGFMAGVLLSATVSVMQSLRLPTLQESLQGAERFQGMASTTMLITWHLAFGLIVACYFLAVRSQPRLYRLTAVALVPIGLFALVVNGAQGGLLGLACAGAAVVAFGWRHVSWRAARPYVLGAIGIGAVVIVALLATGVDTQTVDGLFGKGDYKNELARYEVNKQGVEELIAHPLVGMGRTNFAEKHEPENGSNLAPHFLPLEAGVTSGLVGFLVASYLLFTLLVVIVRGPVGRTPSSWLGLALCAAMFGNALTETGGPFTGLPRFALLLISVVACRGEPWPSAPTGAHDDDEQLSPGTSATAR